MVAETVDTLADNFNGTTWSVVSSTNNQTSIDNELWSVSCPGSNNCWSVGTYLAPGVFSLTPSSVSQTLIEQNTGSGWTTVTSPNVTIPVGRSDPTGQTTNILLGVSCASTTDCRAAGWYYNSVGISQPLLEHYDGSAWSITSGPNVDYSAIEGINCDAANDCWAVGWILIENSAGTGIVYKTLIEHYDGSAWSIVTSPNTSSSDNNELFGVSCTSATNCWTVGFSFADSSSAAHTLIEHYDGIAWSIVASPNTNDSDSDYLVSVACSAANDCTAVGYYFDAVTGHTLIEHYTMPQMQLTSVVSRKTHGNAGSFDIDLPFSSTLPVPPPGIECRAGGGTGGDHTLVFAFSNTPVSGSATMVSGTGSVNGSPTFSGNTMIVNLTGVANAQVIGLTLNVTDNFGQSFTNPENIPISMGVLLGDVNASRRVDAADVSFVRQQTLRPIDSSNFREDINTSGRIDAADVSIARQQTLTSLP